MTQQVPPENLMGERDSQLRMLTHADELTRVITVVPRTEYGGDSRCGWRRQRARATIGGERPQRCGRSADGVNVMATSTMTWRRLARRRDRNPLRRRADLIEGWLLPAAIAVFLAVSPLVVAAAGAGVRADNAAATRAQLSWHRVPAVLLKAAPGPEMSDNGANTWVVWTPARWTSGGRSRTGSVPAPAGTRAGSTVRVWLDRAGNVRTPPLTAAQVSDRVIAATLIALAGLAVFMASMALLIRRVLDRRRLAGWESDWLSVGPQWSHQR